MLNFFSKVSKKIEDLREIIWNYPEVLFGDNSLRTFLQRYYRVSVPYSHFIFSFILILIVVLSFFTNFLVFIRAESQTLVEGVVMGEDTEGNVITIGRLDPLRPSNVQLERDLSELIYEPLLRVEYTNSGDGEIEVENILAEDVIRIRQGADYQFALRKDVFWHDGVPLTSDDVVATFNLVSQLDANNAYIRAIKQLRWEKLDEHNIRVCTKTEDIKSCEQSSDNPIFSNFLELISIKIIPAHRIEKIDPRRIDFETPDLFKSPIGTGRYKLFAVEGSNITLEKNNDYYNKDRIPSIDRVQFKLFPRFEDAIKALENGEIHTFASVSGEYKKNLSSFPQIQSNLSPVLYNQYWGIYFNLRKNLDNNPIASPFFQDINVRRAISMGINRSTIIENSLLGLGEEATGPIPSISEFYNKNAPKYGYNPEKARELLENSGWKIKDETGIRTNDAGERLSFSLYFVDSFDRNNVARALKNDLENIGVEVITDRRQQQGQDSSEESPTGWTLNDINNQFLLPRTFDAILYGMYTFVDPDRFELFHKSQIQYPGLNISGYVGTEQSVQINPNRKQGEGSLINVPKVDKLLEETRAFDAIVEKDRRIKNYKEIQELILDDSPVVFLYHPRFVYYSHINLSKTDLTKVTSIEDRFRNIERWILN